MPSGISAAIALHGLAATMLALGGLVYAIRNGPMPYHLDALGDQSVDDLSPNVRVLLSSGVGVAGGGMLATSLAMFVLVIWPLRAGEIWCRFAIPAIASLMVLSLLRATAQVGSQTPARPPAYLLWIGLCLVWIGFVASWF